MVIGNRNIKIEPSEFKGKWYVMIREFYEDENGELKPGKKGINLKLEEWNEIVEKINNINVEVQEAVD